ncbi:hypothetical protein Acor_15360 [Acrocarpospora corrugata]|uniref:Thioesterase domain-containing protein n=1 Tax=Acrocarpospora corrugata TaxID=35763 RepID=A0A5M3VWJ6_9ACTN|nr:hypothetical protein [Acrocarpospora corrugata]GER99472.1 hypothetical protein Acor_15360 [Acrocarpospora corrugata]
MLTPSPQQLRVTDFDHLGHISAPRLLELVINAGYDVLPPAAWVISHQEITYRQPLTREAAARRSIEVHSEIRRTGRTSLTLAKRQDRDRRPGRAQELQRRGTEVKPARSALTCQSRAAAAWS